MPDDSMTLMSFGCQNKEPAGEPGKLFNRHPMLERKALKFIAVRTAEVTLLPNLHNPLNQWTRSCRQHKFLFTGRDEGYFCVLIF